MPLCHPNPVSSNRRRGGVIPFVVMSMLVLLGFAALSVDVGLMYWTKAQLQRTADAAALAGASQLPHAGQARLTAQDYATRNSPNQGTVLSQSDIVLGNWDRLTAVFTPGKAPFNAISVLAKRSQTNSNPLALIFGPVVGVKQSEVSAAAIAINPAVDATFRFLIDDEMFDTDEPAIEDLASDLGVASDDLLSDADNDDFIDIPPGVVLELPTGQIGDEALFETSPDFPFTPSSNPSLQDFLLYDEDGPTYGISPADLDPLLGVEPFNDVAAYPLLVNPDHILVSPVYKSDVSDTEPGVNARGERRGLVAFKIIGIGVDPPGSYLPHLIIEIVSPDEVDMGQVTADAGGARPLQLVH